MSSSEREFDPMAVARKLRASAEYVRLATLAKLLRPETDATPVVDAVGNCLEDASVAVRELAGTALGRIGAPAVTALTKGLHAQQPTSVRIAAASGLAQAGPAASQAIEPLCRCFEDNDEHLRWHASFALGKIGVSAVPALRERLQSQAAAVIRAAMDALGWIGPAAKDAVEEIKARIAAAPPRLRLVCLAALVNVTGEPQSGTPMIEEMLQDPDAALRQACLEQLGYLRTHARASAPSIIKCLEDPIAAIRAAAALALARIEATDTEAVDALIRLLGDAESKVRKNAGIALGGLGPQAIAALPALHAMGRREELHLAAIAKAALKSIEGKQQ